MTIDDPQEASPNSAPSPNSLSALQALSAAAQALFFLAYPFAIYTAHTRLETRPLGFALIALLGLALLIRMRRSLRELGDVLKQHLGIVAMIGLAIALDERVFLLFLPAAVSLYLLFTFQRSLSHGQPMIERFARIVEDDLPDFTLPYCRRVTQIWCGFFAANAIVVCALALAAPLAWWAVYSGLLFYGLLGALLAGEFVFRKLWFRYYTQGAADVVFARLFPAERTERGRRSLAYDARRREAQPSC